MVSKKSKTIKKERNEVEISAIRKEIDEVLRQKNILSKKLDKLMSRWKQQLKT